MQKSGIFKWAIKLVKNVPLDSAYKLPIQPIYYMVFRHFYQVQKNVHFARS